MARTTRLSRAGLIVASLIGSFLSPSVQAERPALPRELITVAELGLRLVEKGRPRVVLVFGDSIGPVAREVLRGARLNVPDYDMPQSDEWLIPSGFFVLEELRVTDDSAVFRGTLGPTPQLEREVKIAGCGVTFTISLRRGTDGEWRVDRSTYRVC